MTIGYSNSAYVVGTGRCGTHLLARLMAEEPLVHSRHECNPINESFHRYCQWNELGVDHRGFLEIKKREIERASIDNHLFFEASAYLSLSVTTLYRAFRSKFLLITRNPVDTVNSLFVKGWYKTCYHADNPDRPVGYHEVGRVQHFFGRLVPRGTELDRWNKLSRIGRIAWYWNMMHLRILDQFSQIPEEDRMVLKLEELSHRKYRQLVDFLQIESQLSERRFKEIYAELPGAGWTKKSPDSWSELELDDFSRQVAPAAELLGYDLPGKRRMAASVVRQPLNEAVIGSPEDEAVVPPCRPADAEPGCYPRRSLPPRSILLAVRPVGRAQEKLAWAFQQDIAGICVCSDDQGTIVGAMPIRTALDHIVANKRVLLFHASNALPGIGIPSVDGGSLGASMESLNGRNGCHDPIDATALDTMDRRTMRDIDYLVVDEAWLRVLAGQRRPTAWDGCRILLQLRSCLGLLKWKEVLQCCEGVVISVDDLLTSMSKSDLLQWLWHHYEEALQQNKCLVVELGSRTSALVGDREACAIAEWSLRLGVSVLLCLSNDASFWWTTLTDIVEMRDRWGCHRASGEELPWEHVGCSDTTSYS